MRTELEFDCAEWEAAAGERAEVAELRASNLRYQVSFWFAAVLLVVSLGGLAIATAEIQKRNNWLQERDNLVRNYSAALMETHK